MQVKINNKYYLQPIMDKPRMSHEPGLIRVRNMSVQRTVCNVCLIVSTFGLCESAICYAICPLLPWKMQYCLIFPFPLLNSVDFAFAWSIDFRVSNLLVCNRILSFEYWYCIEYALPCRIRPICKVHCTQGSLTRRYSTSDVGSIMENNYFMQKCVFIR